MGWLSGYRVLDWKSKGRGFKSHQEHKKNLYIYNIFFLKEEEVEGWGEVWYIYTSNLFSLVCYIYPSHRLFRGFSSCLATCSFRFSCLSFLFVSLSYFQTFSLFSFFQGFDFIISFSFLVPFAVVFRSTCLLISFTIIIIIIMKISIARYLQLGHNALTRRYDHSEISNIQNIS